MKKSTDSTFFARVIRDSIPLIAKTRGEVLIQIETSFEDIRNGLTVAAIIFQDLTIMVFQRNYASVMQMQELADFIDHLKREHSNMLADFIGSPADLAHDVIFNRQS